MKRGIFPQAGAILESVELRDEDFHYFRELIHRLAGISLSGEKKELVRSRLRMHLQVVAQQTFSDYRRYLESLPTGDPEWQVFVNLLTTNKSEFFRESQHFDFLVQDFLPEWLKSGEKTLKIWSCAASSGEEPYTLAMVLDRHLPKDRDFKILATDIDTKILQKAKNAVYPVLKLSEIPTDYRRDYVKEGTGEVAQWFSVKAALKNTIEFKPHNLLDKDGPTLDKFDLIFCRNVMIYFSKATIETLVAKLRKIAKPKGLLFLSPTENLQGIKTDWKTLRPAIYQRGPGI